MAAQRPGTPRKKDQTVNLETLGMEIGKNGLIVRVPMSAGEKDIRAFLDKHRSWIEKHLAERPTLLHDHL